MFAPPVAKPKAKLALNSNDTLTLLRSAVGKCSGNGPVERAHLLQIDNQPMSRFRARPANVAQDERGAHETIPGAARTAAQHTAPSWDFSTIPAFSPGHEQPLSTAPRLAIQAKLNVGTVNDPMEHEADRIADQVMRMPAREVSAAAASPQVSRKCAQCEEDDKLQKKEARTGEAAGEAPPIVQEVLRLPGQPLDAETRSFMEPRFRHDFSRVRVHTGVAAGQSARDVNAHAYTVGHNMVFDAGRFAPATQEGRRLIAHELTHVVQQGGAAQVLQRRHEPTAEERATIPAEAEAVATAPPSAPVNVTLASSPSSLQRTPAHKRDHSGQKEAVVHVRWTQDSWDLGDRLVAAVAHDRAFRSIPETSLPQVLNHAAGVLTSDPSNGRLKPGHRVSIRVSMVYDPERTPELSSISVTIVDAASPATHATPPPAVAGSGHTAPPNAAATPIERTEHTDPTLEEQEAWLLRTYSDLAARADHNGNDGIVFVVENNGHALRPTSFAVIGQPQTRPAGIAEISPQSASAELKQTLDVITHHPGQWKVVVLRDPSRAMHFKSFEQTAAPAAAPQQPATPERHLTDSQQFELETGMVDPRRINQKLHDIGAEALRQSNPFSLKNLPYTIAGVVVPMGAMKLVMMDSGELTGLVRLEWQVDETAIEQSEAGVSAKTANMREIQVGDVIETPQGTQRVVEVKPGKLVTEPHTEGVAAEAKTPPVAKTPEEPGATPPQAIQPAKPLLTPEDLNKPVPQYRSARGPKRLLNSTERKNANTILKLLDRIRNGDQAALTELGKFRVKPLTGDLAGWYEVDLLEGNPGALNQMRLVVKIGKGAAMEVKLLQMH